MKEHAKIIRRMGFVRDQEGIMNRYIGESSQWQHHLEKTRTFIAGSFTGTQAESVAVLGSGWLLDVPLDELRLRFGQVYLVDIHHPPQIRKKIAGMEGVELIEEDLSGGAIEQVWKLLRKNKSSFPATRLVEEISLIPPLAGIQPDALISVNLLNQLDILLCDHIRRKLPFQQELSISFRAAIQAFHLEWLTKKAGCLVTDTTEHRIPHKGKKSSKRLLYTDLPEGIRRDRWQWDFDSRGTYHPGSRTRMEVQAIEWS
ncbi:MAG: hypothetical protein E4H10_02795 [Bacteroidia bacterium]|nr:MAG: hypothetical protein E4H10_02795 [Bacteroidia bacterium]